MARPTRPLVGCNTVRHTSPCSVSYVHACRMGALLAFAGMCTVLTRVHTHDYVACQSWLVLLTQINEHDTDEEGRSKCHVVQRCTIAVRVGAAAEQRKGEPRF